MCPNRPPRGNDRQERTVHEEAATGQRRNNQRELNAVNLREDIIHAVETSHDPALVQRALGILQEVVVLEGSPFATIMVRDGIPAVLSSMERLGTQHSQVLNAALGVFINMTSARRAPQVMEQYHRTLVSAGIIEICIRHLRRSRDDDDDDESNNNVLPVAQWCCRLLSNIADRGGHFGSLSQRKAAVNAAIDVMRHYPNNVTIQGDATGLLVNITGAESEAAVAHHVMAYGGIEAIMGAMKRHLSDANVQQSGIAALCHCANVRKVGVVVHQKGAVKVVMTSLQAHGTNVDIQINGCNFLNALAWNRINTSILDTLISRGSHEHLINLMRHERLSTNAYLMSRTAAALWNFSGHPSAAEHLYEMGIIPQIIETMGNHEDIEDVQVNAVGVLWNFSGDAKYQVVISEECDGVTAICKAMEKHRRSIRVQREATGVLFFLSRTRNERIRKTLFMSNAISALTTALHEHLGEQPMPPLGSQFDWGKYQFQELLFGALDHLGCVQHSVIGDEDFDGSDKESQDDEFRPIESPPFDVGDLLGKDLATDEAPGWFRHMGFTLVVPPWMQAGDDCRGFVAPSKAPKMDQHVCLRIVLPYGGRGFLVGTVTEIGAIPTSKEFQQSSSSSSDSKSFGNKGGWTANKIRKESLRQFGAVNGQDFKSIVSLEKAAARNHKLRYPPLATFFRGRDAKYTVVIRALVKLFDGKDELYCRLEVVRIDEAHKSNKESE